MKLQQKLVFLLASAVLLAALGLYPATGVASPSLAPVLTVAPNTAVPNQTVVLLGTGFTPVEPNGAAFHRISGSGSSVITVGGTVIAAPNVTYPISFDAVGNWAAPITIPLTPGIVSGGLAEIRAVDDAGLTMTTQLGIRTPSISLDPAASSRSTDVSVTGVGFPASNPATSASIQVSISYNGTELTVVSPNNDGDIIATIRVPDTAAIPSSNLVRATIVGFSQSASATHTTPLASITVSPSHGRPGSVVTISGEDFPGRAIVSGTRAGIISVARSPAPYTDTAGNLVTFFVAPLFAPANYPVSATAGGITAVTVFTRDTGPAVTQPTVPEDVFRPAIGLDSLTKDDNLIRAWNFDNSTKSWSFFDPRPAFANANTIQTLDAGRVYWLQVNNDQSAVLNGKLVLVYKGWNLVPW